ncbi:RNB domain-containing ribonuclease [Prochlorococcus sp. MIT 1341]|uniref:RNB domain-containing ribonuclease n=1 Tax=Prochlorococcus sp. MIT 1341 TaxID=3096221 RepID=UPI002A7475E3|nr:RNB domain-containing ribonuclease [Prochlorococcus sp. MIT 1341]
MKFTVENILDLVPEQGTLETKKLEKILKLTKKEQREQLNLAISALGKIGLIQEVQSGEISKFKHEGIIEARLRCSSKGYCFALREDDGDDIYIRDHNLNNAWNGDRVLVRINREGIRRRSPEGAVQCILERNSTTLVCMLEKTDDKIIANPLDERINAVINIEESNNNDSSIIQQAKIVEVKIDLYPVGQYPAKGHVVRPLTLDAGKNGDLDILLTKSNLNQEVNPPRSSLKTPSQKKRVDLTNQPSLLLRSWQGKDAPPLSAIYVEPQAAGVRLWLHAPAISERLTVRNSLDNWLREKGESHCLTDEWKPLLNKTLTKQSEFQVGEQNESVSLRVDISPTGNIEDWEFYLANVKPVALITPEMLTALSERKPKARTLPAILKPIKDHIDTVKTTIFAASLIKKREESIGLIQLELPIPKLEYLGDLNWQNPDTNNQEWILPIDETDPNSILSVFTREANRIWAKHLQDINLPGLVLESQPIDTNSINDVAKSAISLEIPLSLNDEGNPTAQELVNSFKDTNYKRVLQQQLTYCIHEPVLKQINCFADSVTNDSVSSILQSNNIVFNQQAPWVNASLHYSDLMNQQVITFLLNDGKSSPTTRSKSKISLAKMGIGKSISWNLFSSSIQHTINNLFTVSTCSKQNNLRRKAKNFKNELISFAQARTLESEIGKELEGTISGIQSYGFFVELPPSEAEGLVHVSSLADDWYEYRSRQNKLVGRKSRKTYQLGDIVKTRVLKVDLLRNQVDLELSTEDTPQKQLDNEKNNEAHQTIKE